MKTKTKTCFLEWQKEVFINSTGKHLTNNIKKIRTHNSTYTQVGVQCLNEKEVLNQSSVFLMKFSAKSPHLREAAKRCASY
jgi:hypothetical protein